MINTLPPSLYSPTADNIWRGRTDTEAKERFFQLINTYDLNHDNIDNISEPYILSGFASDEGIRRNSGRIGAKSGPDALRHHFGKLACHHDLSLADIGNVLCTNQDLELSQQTLASIVSQSHQTNKKTIILGGGHEISWPHYQGLISHFPNVGIINFDAHFDLRPLNHNQATSGSGFFQISQLCQTENKPFDYCCLGIQNHSNSRQLFDLADELNVNFMTATEMRDNTFAWQTAFLDEFMLHQNHLYISICLDVFAEAFAPGVSAPQPTGMMPWQIQSLLKYILQTGKVIAIDIAELSPPLDHDDKTARLAANLLADIFNFY